jgi:hypothetical protein
MLSTFWSALWRSGAKRARPARPTGVRLFLEPLEERALLSSGPSIGGTGPTPSTDSTSGSQPAVVQTSGGCTGSSGTTGSGNTNISGPGYPWRQPVVLRLRVRLHLRQPPCWFRSAARPAALRLRMASSPSARVAAVVRVQAPEVARACEFDSPAFRAGTVS